MPFRRKGREGHSVFELHLGSGNAVAEGPNKSHHSEYLLLVIVVRQAPGKRGGALTECFVAILAPRLQNETVKIDY